MKHSAKVCAVGGSYAAHNTFPLWYHECHPSRDGYIFHNPITFHPTNGVFNADSDGGDTTIGRFLRQSEFPATRCFLRLEDRDARQDKALEALILIQATAGWQGLACQLGNALIRGLSFTGVAQETRVTGLVDHEEVFELVTLLLATVILDYFNIRHFQYLL
jgi:hypothetical protein